MGAVLSSTGSRVYSNQKEEQRMFDEDILWQIATEEIVQGAKGFFSSIGGLTAVAIALFILGVFFARWVMRHKHKGVKYIGGS